MMPCDQRPHKLFLNLREEHIATEEILAILIIDEVDSGFDLEVFFEVESHDTVQLVLCHAIHGHALKLEMFWVYHRQDLLVDAGE